MNRVELNLPLDKKSLSELKTGQWVELNGNLLTGRDAALMKIDELMRENKQPPINFKDQLLYFVGPTPASEGEVIGSAGPTTSTRMEKYFKHILAAGVVAFMGKGPLSTSAVTELHRHGAVYFAAAGGAGAFYGSKIKGAAVEAYEELGPEAIYNMRVEKFPVVVAIDLHGGNLFEDGPKYYLKEEGRS